jgi:hypothetical protein
MLEIDREPSELANLCRRGTVTFLTATAAQLEDLHRATAPVLAWLRKDAGTREALDRIESMRARLAAAGTAEERLHDELHLRRPACRRGAPWRCP